jgi:hypothetical protein
VVSPRLTASWRSEADRGVLRHVPQVQDTHVPPLLVGVEDDEDVRDEGVPGLGAWAGAETPTSYRPEPWLGNTTEVPDKTKMPAGMQELIFRKCAFE